MKNIPSHPVTRSKPITKHLLDNGFEIRPVGDGFGLFYLEEGRWRSFDTYADALDHARYEIETVPNLEIACGPYSDADPGL